MPKKKTVKKEYPRDILIYAGTRIGKKDTRMFCYFRPSNDDFMFFGKKLRSYSSVGDKLEVGITEDGVAKPYHTVGVLQPGEDHYEQVTQWSVEERLAIEEFNAIQIARRGSDDTIENYVEKMIDSLRGRSRVDKSRIARYVYDKILKS